MSEQLRDGKTKVANVFDHDEALQHINTPSRKTKGDYFMRHKNKIRLQRRHRRKFFWLFALAAVSALVFAEQIALLYVLSTFAMVGLLIVVAFSNLEARDREMQAVTIRQDDISAKSKDLSRRGKRAA